MFKAFFGTKEWSLWAYGGGLFLLLVIWVQVNISVAFNVWYADFYNLLQTADTVTDANEGMMIFMDQLIGTAYLTEGFHGHPSFSVLAFPYILISAFANWFTRIYTLRWREAMTFSYIPNWRQVQHDIEGASQRIQEDCYRLSVIIQSLGAQVTRAVLTLVAFIPILWGLSQYVSLPWLADTPGSLVWASLIFSLGGLVISWFVGIKLPGLEYNNQKVEAAFRKELVLGEDNKIDYASQPVLWELFSGIRFNYHRLFLHYSYFDLWLTSYSQVMIIFPYLIMGPSLFSGVIMLGTLVQIANAFDKVHSSFSLFLENWTVITELRSIFKRLREFQDNIGYHDRKTL